MAELLKEILIGGIEFGGKVINKEAKTRGRIKNQKGTTSDVDNDLIAIKDIIFPT